MKKITMMAALALAFCFVAALRAEDDATKTWTSDEAWSFLKNYQYGDDWTPLLLIENEVEKANNAPESEKAMAAKLAEYLTDDCSMPCRQFACMQLRMVGGPAQVPALAALLQRPDELENARIALEVIPGEESLAAIRAALKTTEGNSLVGVINSLAKRKDAVSFPDIVELTKSEDPAVKSAAVYALGKFGPSGLDALNKANFPVDDQIAGQAALTVAAELVSEGKAEAARPIYEKYAVESAQRGCRKASLVGLLNLTGEKKSELIIEWFTGNDPMKVKLAAACLSELSAEEFAQITSKQASLSDVAKIAFLEIAAEKEGKAIFDRLVGELKSADPVVQATAARLLGRLGDASAVPALLPLLASSDSTVASAARETLQTLPQETVGPALIDTMKKNGAEAAAAIDLLASMKYYEAINPMIEMAKSTDPKVHDAPINGLAKLADPDDNDLPRMMNLYAHAAKNGYRDKVERAIVVICKDAKDAGQKIVAGVDKVDGKISAESNALVLPLLGKLGGEFAHQQIRAAMNDSDPKIAAAAFRGFCNWPDATYADELWQLASQGNDAVARQMALRAYVRVVTLKSDRPAAETLGLLKKAFAEAKTTDDKTLVLTRASEVRTMDAVNWLAEFLDDATLSEAAGASIAKLAHHRELREPNKAAFTPILEKVEKTVKNKAVAEAAKKARMGM